MELNQIQLISNQIKALDEKIINLDDSRRELQDKLDELEKTAERTEENFKELVEKTKGKMYMNVGEYSIYITVCRGFVFESNFVEVVQVIFELDDNFVVGIKGEYDQIDAEALYQLVNKSEITSEGIPEELREAFQVNYNLLTVNT